MTQGPKISLDALLEAYEERHSSENKIDEIYGEDDGGNEKEPDEEEGFIIDDPINTEDDDDGGFIVQTPPVQPIPQPKPLGVAWSEPEQEHRNPPGLWRCLCGHEANDTRYCIICGRYWEECQPER